MTITRTRTARIDAYEAAASSLRDAVANVPEAALAWTPSPDEFSIREIIWHLADGEVVNATRLRYALAEPDAEISGYDEQAWVRSLGYIARPLAQAVAVFEALRAANTSLLRLLSDDAWTRAARRSDDGSAYTAETFLERTAAHLSDHAGQLRGLLDAWRAAGGPSPAEGGRA